MYCRDFTTPCAVCNPRLLLSSASMSSTFLQLHLRHLLPLILPPLLILLLLLSLLLPLLLPLLLVLLGWAAADSDWSGRTWGSPYAIAVMDIEGFVQENQGGGSGGCKYCTLLCSYHHSSIVHDRDLCDCYLSVSDCNPYAIFF
jgi:hypothetical protein